MLQKRVVLFACCLFLVPLSPTAGQCHHHHGGGAALVWGVTGFLLGSTLAAASYRPPPTVVYTTPPPPVYPPPVTYGSAPYVPAAGSCRWERYVLDGYGRVMLDAYGRPVKEYAVGSCRYPPY